MTAMDRFWFLLAAYGAIWVLMASFLMRLGRRHRALERELRDLESRLPPRPEL
ncbi:MAG: CcmD family protein [Deltaproteobacteria bacterium]|nr:CcmD family protein [Deltaproteobacteria bacterium]